MRRLYDYLTVDQKKDLVKKLRVEREELKKETDQNLDSYPLVVKQVLSDTLDKWALEIEQLEEDVKNNIGPIKKI